METWEVELLNAFRNLQKQNVRYAKTSDCTDSYNCIAWAAEDNEDWWWPIPYEPHYYWPEVFPFSDDVSVFIKTFARFDYEPCDDGSFEPDYEKVAIYAVGRNVKHMARQKDTGMWTSKLGSFIDIDHATPQGIENKEYGDAVQYMKRPRQQRGGD